MSDVLGERIITEPESEEDLYEARERSRDLIERHVVLFGQMGQSGGGLVDDRVFARLALGFVTTALMRGSPLAETALRSRALALPAVSR